MFEGTIQALVILAAIAGAWRLFLQAIRVRPRA